MRAGYYETCEAPRTCEAPEGVSLLGAGLDRIWTVRVRNVSDICLLSPSKPHIVERLMLRRRGHR